MPLHSAGVYTMASGIAAVLAAPHARVFRHDDDGVGAEVLEFPGCYSAGADGPGV